MQRMQRQKHQTAEARRSRVRLQTLQILDDSALAGNDSCVEFVQSCHSSLAFPGTRAVPFAFRLVNACSHGIKNGTLEAKQELHFAKLDPRFFPDFASHGLFITFPRVSISTRKTQTESVASFNCQKTAISTDYRDRSSEPTKQRKFSIKEYCGSRDDPEKTLPHQNRISRGRTIRAAATYIDRSA